MEKYLPIVNRSECNMVKLDDILYIRKEGRKINIVTEKAAFYEYCRMGEVEEHLDERFYNCLKGVIINFNQVQGMRDQTIIFRNGITFELGRDSFIRTKQTFAAYIKGLKNLQIDR